MRVNPTPQLWKESSRLILKPWTPLRSNFFYIYFINLPVIINHVTSDKSLATSFTINFMEFCVTQGLNKFYNSGQTYSAGQNYLFAVLKKRPRSRSYKVLGLIDLRLSIFTVKNYLLSADWSWNPSYVWKSCNQGCDFGIIWS